MTAGDAQLPEPDSGPARRRRAQGTKSDALMAAMARLDPELAEWSDRFIFGDVWGRPGLSHDERLLVAITVLTATERTAQLRAYAWGALQAGLPASKIHEAIVMMVVYAGFPATLNALIVWREVVESARRAGIEVDLPEIPADGG